MAEGRLDDALCIINHAATQFPDSAPLFLLLGEILTRSGAHSEALQAYRLAVELDPGAPDSLFHLGRAEEDQGHLDEAILAYHRAIGLRPGFVEALNNLGDIATRLGEYETAQVYLQGALEQAPTSPEVLTGLGNLRKHQRRFDEARALYRKCLGVAPGHAVAANNLASLLPPSEAIPVLEALLREQPDFAEAHYALAMNYLRSGRLERGWQEYEWRFRKEAEPVARRPYPYPLWDGRALEAGSLLVWGEQGVGDEIAFAGCIDDLHHRIDTLVIECDPRLSALFQRSFPYARILARADQMHDLPPGIVCQVASGSLMRWLRPDIASFRRQKSPYLVPDDARIAYWRDWLHRLGPGPKAGLCWRSIRRDGLRGTQYAAIEDCGGLIADPRCTWVNLQYGDCTAELDQAATLFGRPLVQPPGIDLMHDLDDLAALLVALDLVVSAGTATARLAGAVGANLVTFSTGRNWSQLGTSGMPWHAYSVNVMRKSHLEPWSAVLRSDRLLQAIAVAGKPWCAEPLTGAAKDAS